MSYFIFKKKIFISKNASPLFLNDKAKEVLAQAGLFVSTLSNISTAYEYNKLIQNLLKILDKSNRIKVNTKIFDTEIAATSTPHPLTEKTPWGIVSLKKVNVEKDFIQKLLVIKKGGILGFEIHKKKMEKLKILEGVCLSLTSNHKAKDHINGSIKLKVVGPSDRIVLYPLDEHGIIALTDCVIEETSTNHLTDLTYIFPSKQVIK